MELYDRHAGVILALAFRILGSRDEAEEVVQESFVRVWQDAADYDAARAGFRAWICTIARNRALDLVRRRSTADRLKGLADVPQSGAGPEADVSDSEDRARIRAAMAKLATPQREALELAYWSGLTHVEIAEKLQAPLGTVKTRILDGMRKLKSLLDGGDV